MTLPVGTELRTEPKPLLAELLTTVLNLQADSGDNLVIADFYAKWCHACRSLFPKVGAYASTERRRICKIELLTSCARVQLCQICRDNPDIKVLKIDWDENKDIAKTLGVKVGLFECLASQTSCVCLHPRNNHYMRSFAAGVALLPVLQGCRGQGGRILVLSRKSSTAQVGSHLKNLV